MRSQSAVVFGAVLIAFLGDPSSAAPNTAPPTKPGQPAPAAPTANPKYVSLTAAEFTAKAPGLLNRDVEVVGDLLGPGMISPKDAGTFKDPAGKTLVQFTMSRPGLPANDWLIVNRCHQPCAGVFARGKIVAGKTAPVLEIVEISKESAVKAAAAHEDLVASLMEKDRLGMAKPLLPPHGVPEATQASKPGTGADHGSKSDGKSVWEQMTDHANQGRQRDYDLTRGSVQGPKRAEDFSTPYRGVGDTGLSMIFKRFGGGVFQQAWPRVAVVIDEEPTFKEDERTYFENGATPDYCWRLHAKVWLDEKQSLDIAPFNWCMSEMRYSTPYAEVSTWGKNFMARRALGNATTGKDRTTGPVPPGTPLPDTPKYHGILVYPNIMVGNVLLDMDLFYGSSDARVWFVEGAASGS